MKQALIERVLKEGTVRTNRFEYRLDGDRIIKRRIDVKEASVWAVAKVIK